MDLHVMQRRTFLKTSAALATAAACSLQHTMAAEPAPLIIDTHQHLWDLAKFKLPWLSGAPEVLKHTYHLNEYREATRGLNVKSVYMEVYVAQDQLVAEAEHVVELSRAGNPTVGAVIGSRPESVEFAAYVDRFKGVPQVKGMRRVLHEAETPIGYCLKTDFVKSVQLLGERGLSFDLCMRATELLDAAKLTELCPNTKFIVDHCGNADPKAFRSIKSDVQPTHQVDEWKKGIDALAARPNTIGKISGIIARMPAGGDANDLAPIVNHCLNAFGPDRVVFGSDWPVCLMGGTLQKWVEMLTQIIADRPAAERQKLWSSNAATFYRLQV
jgi:predicted TIM-barrel fold metal-dependent hydrolase